MEKKLKESDDENTYSAKPDEMLRKLINIMENFKENDLLSFKVRAGKGVKSFVDN